MFPILIATIVSIGHRFYPRRRICPSTTTPSSPSHRPDPTHNLNLALIEPESGMGAKGSGAASRVGPQHEVGTSSGAGGGSNVCVVCLVCTPSNVCAGSLVCTTLLGFRIPVTSPCFYNPPKQGLPLETHSSLSEYFLNGSKPSLSCLFNGFIAPFSWFCLWLHFGAFHHCFVLYHV